MGSYITATDIYDLYSQASVDDWTGSDADVLARMIDRGEADVLDSFVGSIYLIPLSGGSSMTTVKTWMAIAAAYWAYRKDGVFDETDRVVQDYNNMKGALAAVVGGAQTLTLNRVSTIGSGPRAVIR